MNLDPTGQPYEPAEIEGGGADDLRTAIAEAIGDSMSDLDDYEPGEFSPEADAVLAVLGDPVHRLAILNLIGDVREVWIADYGQWWDEYPGGGELGHLDRVLVVRPRGEATDA